MAEERNEQRETNEGRAQDAGVSTENLTFFGMNLPPAFVFWFAAIMVIVSTFVIIQKSREWWVGDITLYYCIITGLRDIGTAIPVASLAVALAVHTRSIRMTIAGYIEDLRRRSREKFRREVEAENNARWDEWLARKEESEAKGQPFDEPPPSRQTKQE